MTHCASSLRCALHGAAFGRFGGIAIVQDPYEATYASLPWDALEYIHADYKVKSGEISGLLVHLANEDGKMESAIPGVGEENQSMKDNQLASLAKEKEKNRF